MEKKTLLAIVLSIMVLIVFSVIQGILYPPAQGTAPSTTSPLETTPPAGEANQPVAPVPGLSSPSEPSPPTEPASLAEMFPVVPGIPDDTIANNASSGDGASIGSQGSAGDGASIGSAGPQLEERVVIETELLTVVLTNAGGSQGEMAFW